MSPLERVLLVIAAIVIAGALVWIAAEEHYQGCVEAASLSGEGPGWDPAGPVQDALNECGRSPF